MSAGEAIQRKVTVTFEVGYEYDNLMLLVMGIKGDEMERHF